MVRSQNGQNEKNKASRLRRTGPGLFLTDYKDKSEFTLVFQSPSSKTRSSISKVLITKLPWNKSKPVHNLESVEQCSFNMDVRNLNLSGFEMVKKIVKKVQLWSFPRLQRHMDFPETSIKSWNIKEDYWASNPTPDPYWKNSSPMFLNGKSICQNEDANSWPSDWHILPK